MYPLCDSHFKQKTKKTKCLKTTKPLDSFKMSVDHSAESTRDQQSCTSPDRPLSVRSHRVVNLCYRLLLTARRLMSPAAFITDIVKVTVKGTSSILQYSRALFLKKTVINPRNTQSLLSAWFMFSNWGAYMNLHFCVLNMFAKWWDVPTRFVSQKLDS